jgi:hypothetical protein
MILLIIVLLLIFGLPNWGYSRGWGYGPSGIIGVILIVLLIMALTGHNFLWR